MRPNFRSLRSTPVDSPGPSPPGLHSPPPGATNLPLHRCWASDPDTAGAAMRYPRAPCADLPEIVRRRCQHQNQRQHMFCGGIDMATAGFGISRSSQRCRPAPWANSPNNTSPDCAVMDSSVAASLKGSTVRAIFRIGAPPANLPAGESFRRDHYTGNPYR